MFLSAQKHVQNHLHIHLLPAARPQAVTPVKVLDPKNPDPATVNPTLSLKREAYWCDRLRSQGLHHDRVCMSLVLLWWQSFRVEGLPDFGD